MDLAQSLHTSNLVATFVTGKVTSHPFSGSACILNTKTRQGPAIQDKVASLVKGREQHFLLKKLCVENELVPQRAAPWVVTSPQPRLLKEMASHQLSITRDLQTDSGHPPSVAGPLA